MNERFKGKSVTFAKRPPGGDIGLFFFSFFKDSSILFTFICLAPFAISIVSRCFTDSVTQSQNPQVPPTHSGRKKTPSTGNLLSNNRWGFLTAVHGGLQTQQQVGQSGLSGSRQACVQAAALLPQIQFTGLGQGVTDSVVLRDELLTDRQSITALRRKQAAEKRSVQTCTGCANIKTLPFFRFIFNR